MEEQMQELVQAVAESIYRDAERYRWLRAQHWNESPLCVVAQPKQAVKPGYDCPAQDRLDAAIDAAMCAAPQPLDPDNWPSAALDEARNAGVSPASAIKGS